LVLLRNIKRELFTVVQTKDGLITGFGSMPSDRDQDPLMFTGIQFMEPAIFKYIPPGVFSHSTTDVYPAAMAAGEKIAAHVASGNWYELSTLRRYMEISLELMKDSGNSITVGAGCTIAAESEVSGSILWDRVKVDAGARINRAVLADGVRITSGETIQNAVVVPAALISGKVPPQKALKGHLAGENFVVPLSL